jgi:hypothetical protein
MEGFHRKIKTVCPSRFAFFTGAIFGPNQAISQDISLDIRMQFRLMQSIFMRVRLLE